MGVSEYSTPNSYCKAALSKLGHEGIDAMQIDSYFERYKQKFKQIAVVWALRAAIGDVIESSILMDRLEYANEAGLTAIIEAVVDPCHSPRNMALIVT